MRASRFGTALPMLMRYAASSGSLVTSAAAQLVTFAILARGMGVEEFSLLVTITAIGNIIVHLCGLGGMEALVRRVARDPSIYPIMLGHNLMLTAASGAVLVSGGVLILPFFLELSPNLWVNAVAIALILLSNVVLVRLITLAEHISLTHRRYAQANLIVVSFAVIRTLAALLACIGFGVATVAEWAVWQFAAHVFVSLIAFVIILPLGKPHYKLVSEEVPQGLYFSTPFILRALRQNADLLVFGLVAGAETAASYGIARRMLDSSYLGVDALHRLVYPGTAKAAEHGLHRARHRIRNLFLATLAISLVASTVLFLFAPLLPYIFGGEYVSLVSFVRIMCWLIIPIGAWAVAMEAMGAAGRQKQRALVLGFGSIIGAAVAAFATWYAPPTGTFISFYLIELAMVIASCAMLTAAVNQDQRLFAQRQT